jgi:hypothetical protein
MQGGSWSMTSRYAPLAEHLRQQRGPHHTMRFAEIEGLIGTRLPASARNARTVRAWWDNDRSPHSHHSQSKHGWLAAGWEVGSPDLDREIATFRKSVMRSQCANPCRPGTANPTASGEQDVPGEDTQHSQNT